MGIERALDPAVNLNAGWAIGLRNLVHITNGGPVHTEPCGAQPIDQFAIARPNPCHLIRIVPVVQQGHHIQRRTFAKGGADHEVDAIFLHHVPTDSKLALHVAAAHWRYRRAPDKPAAADPVEQSEGF